MVKLFRVLLSAGLLVSCLAPSPEPPPEPPPEPASGPAPVPSPSVAPEPASPGLIPIRGGEFLMGRSGDLAGTDDHWPHRVRVDDYRLAATELTNQDFAEVYNWALQQQLIEVEEAGRGSVRLYDRQSARLLHETWSREAQVGDLPRLEFQNGRMTIDPEYASHPVVRVSWYAAAAYCRYRSLREGLQPVFDGDLTGFDLSRNGYRLPTEAEWEYAARERGRDLDYSWGAAEQISGNVADRSYHRKYPQHPVWDINDGYVYTAPVGSFTPNSLGLYDLSGNAVEWCLNWFYRYPGYANADYLENPAGPAQNPPEGRFKTWRGGGWYDHGLKLVTTSRGFYAPENAGSISDLGFRLARSGW